MKNKILIAIALCVNSTIPVAVQAATLYQFGNASALFSGVVNGELTIQKLKSIGDFGLGAIDNINGEMVVLDGVFYQIKANGITTPLSPISTTPYAVIANFQSEMQALIPKIMNYKDLNQIILTYLNNRNHIYALKLSGNFELLKMRSRKPRKALATKKVKEDVYSITNVKGTLVGFYFPEYLLSLSVPGLHFHFISDDKKLSGHVLNIKAHTLKLNLQEIDILQLQLPNSSTYKNANIKTATCENYRNSQMTDNN